jgi:hypothetical protein
VGQNGRKSRSIASAALPSSAINKKKLVPPETVIENNRNLMCPSKVPILALKLEKESFFGQELMARCTVAGSRPTNCGEESAESVGTIFFPAVLENTTRV